MAKILILEDDIRLAELWRGWLDDAGHEVLASHDRSTAESLCNAHVFDLIISDFFIRNRSGALQQDGAVTFLAHLRNPAIGCTPSWGKAVPVLVVTGATPNRYFNALDQARNLGANGTLAKPVSEVELREECERLLGMPRRQTPVSQ